MRQKKNILIIEAGFQIYKEHLLKSMYLRPDVNLIIASGLEGSVPCDWAKKYAALWISFNYREKNFLNRLKRICKRNKLKIDGVITYVEPSVRFTNKLQHQLGLPPILKKENSPITNKRYVRETLKALPQPKFAIAKDNKVPKLQGLKFPLVVKPAEMMAGIGVCLVSKKAALLEAIKKARLADFNGENLRARYKSIAKEVLIEERIGGIRYSVESLVQNGFVKIIGITSKMDSRKSFPFFDEYGHIFPENSLGSETKNSLHEYVHHVHAKLGIQNAITHTEIKIFKNKPLLIEINCRIAGGLISTLIKRATGWNPGHALIDIACGTPTQEIPSPTTQEAIGFLGVRSEGKIDRILKKELKKSFLYAKEGEVIWRDGLHGRTRVGHRYLSTKAPPSLSFLDVDKYFKISKPLLSKIVPSKDTILIFHATNSDLHTLIEIEEASWEKRLRASQEDIERRMRRSDCITLLAYSVKETRFVGFLNAATCNESFLQSDYMWKNYSNFKNPVEKTGNHLYVINVSSIDNAPKGVATSLLEGIAKVGKSKGLKGFAYGGRFKNFSTYAQKNNDSIQNYCKGVINGKYTEPSIKMGLNMGAKFLRIIPNYFNDPYSKNFGALMYYAF